MLLTRLEKLSATIMLGILVSSLFVVALLVTPASGTGEGWLPGWEYRKSVVINKATGAGTDYIVKINVNYSSGSEWLPYFDLSSRSTTITGGEPYHGFDVAHKTTIMEVDKVIDGVSRKYLAYDSDPTGNNARLYYSDDVGGTWTAYTGNPILSSPSSNIARRLPSVAWDGSTFHMFIHNVTGNKIEHLTSTDGIHFTYQEDVIGNNGYSSNVAYAWFNPNDNRWYLYSLKVVGSSTFEIVARNSTDINDLKNASDVLVYSETGSVHVAPWSIMYRDNAYWIAGESQVAGIWVVRAIKSASPTSGFKLCSNSPILTNDEACPRQFVGPDGTKAYLFSNRDSNHWYQDTREIYTTYPAAPTSNQLNVEKHSRKDFGDIRFTDSGGSTELKYWMEKKLDGNYSIFRVKIPNDLTSADATIYMYYGKSDATTTSNGIATFPFFDDFLGTSLNTSKWYYTAGSVSVGSSICTILDASSSRDAILGKTSYGIGYAYEAYSSTPTGQASLILAAFGTDPTQGASSYCHMFSGTTTTQNATGKYLQQSWSGDVVAYHTYRIERINTTRVKFYQDNVLETTHSSYIDKLNEAASFTAFGGVGTAKTLVDWVFVRKFVAPEPYVTSWGNEEPIPTKLYVNPSFTDKAYGDVGTSFLVNVTIDKVLDLYGFDINLTWNNNLITFGQVSYAVPLNAIWGSSHWSATINATGVTDNGTGWYKLVAVSTLSEFNSTAPTTLVTLAFHIENPQTNFIKTTSLHFDTHKLGRRDASAITHTTEDGTYRITGVKPTLTMDPTGKTCRKLNEAFTVKISVSDAYDIQGFGFDISFNTTLLNCTSVTWGELGSGTYSVDEVSGLVQVKAGPNGPISGNRWLANVTLKAAFYHVWKNEANIPEWKNTQVGMVFFLKANLTYPGNLALHYDRTGVYEIVIGPNATYTWSPIKGDVLLDGSVDISDLVAVAYHYDATPASIYWKEDYELTNPFNERIIDLYDLVVIASNYGASYP